MKRKLFLLPITLTALTPTISLCGCTIGGGGDTPEPEPPEPEDAIELNTIRNAIEIGPAEQISVKAGQPVTFTIHFKNFKSLDTSDFKDNCFASDYWDTKMDTAYYSSISIRFDKNEFKMNDPTAIYWFEFDEDRGMSDIHSPLSFSNYELGVFVVTYKKDYKNFHPFFQIGT